MQITKGRRARAQKVVVYGPEGIGKSTFAAEFPDPVFIDTEGSTDNMDVARLDKPTSWTMLNNEIAFVKANPTSCKTLVIDTIDWAESMAIQSVCAAHNKKGIEDFGWGNGYTYVAEEIRRFLDKLSELVDLGINVVLTAHAQLKKFEQPDEMGSYDRYELKLGKKTSSQTAPIVKEWADMVLFANYKTHITVDDKTGKGKAQGGERVMYTNHRPAWDAKNRHGLPDELPFNFSGVAHVFASAQPILQQPSQPQAQPTAPQPAQEAAQAPVAEQTELPIDMKQVAEKPQGDTPVNQNQPNFSRKLAKELSSAIPKALQDLMIANQVTESELHEIQNTYGHTSVETPFENYPPDYFDYLISIWDAPDNGVMTVVNNLRNF